MTKTSEATSGKVTEESLNDLIIDAIQDIKGKKIVKLDLRTIEDASTDYFIVCQGDSATQIKAIADNINFRVKKEIGIAASRVEGKLSANWICVDYFNTVVHIFYHETREFYQLEELWSDAEMIEYEDL